MKKIALDEAVAAERPRGAFTTTLIALAEQSSQRTPLSVLAQTIRIKGMGQEHTDADEDEERRYDFSHSFPPCIAIPERTRLRNPR
jgi:hypothetical protein